MQRHANVFEGSHPYPTSDPPPVLPIPPAWFADALCAQVDTDMFFPERGASTKPAKAVCAMCNVREKCLEYAMERDEKFGVWGGVSEFERRPLRKARRAA